MADMISECCEDCISWNGRCLEGIDFEELADNGDCYAYEPRSFYFDTKKEQAEKARREQKEIDEMEAIAEDLIKHPVHQSFSTVKGKSFRLVNLMPGALPDEGPLSYGVKNGQVFSREELNRKLSWYRMQKKWYEIEYQEVDIEYGNPENLPGLAVLIDDDVFGRYHVLHFLVII